MRHEFDCKESISISFPYGRLDPSPSWRRYLFPNLRTYEMLLVLVAKVKSEVEFAQFDPRLLTFEIYNCNNTNIPGNVLKIKFERCFLCHGWIDLPTNLISPPFIHLSCQPQPVLDIGYSFTFFLNCFDWKIWCGAANQAHSHGLSPPDLEGAHFACEFEWSFHSLDISGGVKAIWKGSGNQALSTE